MAAPLGPTQTHTSASVVRGKQAKLIGPTSIVGPGEYRRERTRPNGRRKPNRVFLLI